MSTQLEAEVQSLQSQLARMRRTQALVALGVVAIGLVAAGRPAGVLQAQRLELVDENGEVHASFGTEAGGTMLQMTGGNAIVTLRAMFGHTDLFMRTDGSMTTGAAVALSADEATSKLSLADPHGNPRVALGTEGDREWVRMIGSTGTLRTELTSATPAAATP